MFKRPVFYLIAACAGLFAAALVCYPGSKYVYVVFTAAFSVLAGLALVSRRSFGYLFLVFFLWLGFWLKASIHFIFTYAYLEPTGLFDFSPASWDAVLMVSALGAAGLMLSYAVYRCTRGPALTDGGKPAGAGAAPQQWRRGWGALLLGLLCLAALNAWLGIHQVGLYHRTVLPWPGNAMVAWLLNIGGSILLAAMAYRDVLAGRSLLPAFIVISLVTTAFSVSMLSRGPFIYQALPLLLAAASLRWEALGKAKLKLGAAAACLALLFAFSVFQVNSYRTRIYSGAVPAAPAAQAPAAEKGGVMHALTQNKHLRQVSGLFVDRWIGLEGVMAVAAYPEKNSGLLKSALAGQRTLEKTAEFEKISGSDFQALDEAKHQFARLPGPVGLFYYSGSRWAVLGGLFALGLLVLGLEAAAWFLTRNPLLCALVGMMAANHAAQLSEAPMQLLPTYVLTFCALMGFRIARSVNSAPTAVFDKAGTK